MQGFMMIIRLAGEQYKKNRKKQGRIAVQESSPPQTISSLTALCVAPEPTNCMFSLSFGVLCSLYLQTLRVHFFGKIQERILKSKKQIFCFVAKHT